MNCNRYPCESCRCCEDHANSPSRSRGKPVPRKHVAAELVSSTKSSWSLTFMRLQHKACVSLDDLWVFEDIKRSQMLSLG